jgi:hypothetical protein
MSECQKCKKIVEDAKEWSFILVNALAQIDEMYSEITALKDENLVLKDSLSRSAKISAEIRSMMEGK